MSPFQKWSRQDICFQCQVHEKKCTVYVGHVQVFITCHGDHSLHADIGFACFSDIDIGSRIMVPSTSFTEMLVAR